MSPQIVLRDNCATQRVAFRGKRTKRTSISGQGPPGRSPMTQSGRFAVLLNLKTAKTLGISIPSTLLARADEVVE
jgi:putative tryptophan/tyrosine transport system substrate-binding protein